MFDKTLWQPWFASHTYVSGLGPGGTVPESAGALDVELNAPAPSPFNTGFMQATSLCTVGGDFDVQVDFALTDWPSTPQHQVQLAVASKSPSNQSARVVVARAQVNALGLNGYVRYQVPGTMFSAVGGGDVAGKLRIVRTGSSIQEFYWNGAAWLSFGTRSWVSDSVSVAFKVSNDSDLTAESASASFDNFSLTAESVSCPVAPGQIATFGAALSSSALGAHADVVFTADWQANSEALSDVETKIPAGFEVADGSTLDDGDTTSTGTLTYDWLCTGISVPIPVAPLVKRPPFDSERLRSRAPVGEYAIDHIVRDDPATGGYTTRVAVSVAAGTAPSAHIPQCPPSQGSETLLGMTSNGEPLVTNPSVPGLYPFLRTGRGSISNTIYTQLSCVAVGGQIGVDFVDADADCLVDELPLVMAPAAAGHSFAPAYAALDPNPANPDIDADGLPDGVEVTLVGSDPGVVDTDADGSPDRIEAVNGSNPNVINSDLDTLLDPTDNCPAATNQDQTDTDGEGDGDACDIDDDDDGMLDGWEASHASCLNPLVIDSGGDPDGDGLRNLTEFARETEPCGIDTDGDGCLDEKEAATNHLFGGQRNPLDYWDFFDVTGDRSIDISDAIDVLGFFGDAGAASTAGDQRDRDVLVLVTPWLTSEANSGVDLTDAINSLLSFGDDCSGPR